MKKPREAGLIIESLDKRDHQGFETIKRSTNVSIDHQPPDLMTQNNDHKDDLDPTATVPAFLRIPAPLAYLLILYAKGMNQSTGMLMTSILRDVLPTFETDDHPVIIRAAKAYRTMRQKNLLQSVNAREVKERIKKRAEGPRSGLRKRQRPNRRPLKLEGKA